ncbi:MAG: HAD family hydrolase, partial [Planctomycetaceae bacterium]
MNNYQAVMFDLDGTLLDTIDDLTDAMNAALAELGFPPRTVDECKIFVGNGVVNFASLALGEGNCNEATLEKLLPIYRNHYAAGWARKTRPYDGIVELIDALKARGLPMAVFSNKPDEFTKAMVNHFFPPATFEVILGARKGRPEKPDPTVAIEIAGQMNVQPSRFLYVGDTNTDMKTAISAGMYAVGALWGFRSADELLANGAKTLIAHPMELLK